MEISQPPFAAVHLQGDTLERRRKFILGCGGVLYEGACYPLVR